MMCESCGAQGAKLYQLNPALEGYADQHEWCKDCTDDDFEEVKV
jgi:hypothetical protein